MNEKFFLKFLKKFLSYKRIKDIIFVTAIIVGGIGLGLLLDHFIPCKDYTTPLFIVLAIHIYLKDMFEKERMKNK